jgi:hypothetical protein
LHYITPPPANQLIHISKPAAAYPHQQTSSSLSTSANQWLIRVAYQHQQHCTRDNFKAATLQQQHSSIPD